MINIKRNHNNKAFTLVELIVVIVILAILATIAFLSFSSQSGSARDSTRLSDISSIKKSVEMYNVNAGTYPAPDKPFSYTYSGGIIWNQGTIGDSAYRMLQKNLSKKVVDPLKGSEYDYSLASNKREYQVAGNFENPTSYEKSLNPFHLLGSQFSSLSSSEANALGGTGVNVYISGNYNGVLLKVFTGSTYYYIPTPTLFGFNPANQQNMEFNSTFSSGTIFLPGINSFANYKADQIYSTGSDKLSDSDITALMQKMQAAYSGSNINTPIIQNTLSSSGNELIQIGIMLVKHTLGGNISSTINTSQLSQWRDIPGSNCTNDDYVFTTGSITYRWSGCNSVFGTGFEWGYKDNGSLGTVSLCYSYNSVSTPANCPIGDLSMSGNSKEKDWTIASGVSGTVNNIWGKFYTWSQASQADNACPTGWHLPSDQEWSILESALSPNCLDVNAENQWRCVSDGLGWLNNNLKTTSNNIVQALKIPLGGYRDANGSTFYDRGGSTSLWSSSASGSNAYRRYLNYNNIGVSRSTKDKLTGYPVRCLKN